MYCDFNPKLFKSFISKGEKIIPALSDDWKIVPDKFRTVGGFSLRSTKLNQEVADINLRMFLRFCKEQNLTINGLKLEGTFIVGNDRKIYTEEMFNEWNEKYNKRTEVIINKKDYIPGHVYKTPCGSKILYLGCRYVTLLKDDKDFTKHTKLTKKYYYCRIDFDATSRYNIYELKMKLSEDLGQSDKLNKEDCDKMLYKYYNENKNITCFEKEKPKNFKNIEYEVIEDEHTDKYNDGLLVSLKDKNGLYTTKGFSFFYSSYVRHHYKMNSDFTFESVILSSATVEQRYRINIKKDEN